MLVDREPKGYASGVYGQVMVLEPEAAEARTLADSDAVFEGSRFTASENSFAEIHLLDGSSIKVYEMTQADLTTATADLQALERVVDLSVLYGSIRAAVQDGFSGPSRFRISTPVAVAGVRGTEFAVDYESENESTIDVFDGEVVAEQDGAEAAVTAGESSRAVRGKKLEKMKLADERGDRWEHFREAMNLHGNQQAASRLQEKIDTVRAADPNDPRLKGLENALQNVTKDREAARAKFDSAREKIQARRQERLEKMKEFAKTHAREKFERARRFRDGAMTEEERKAAGERLRERRKDIREKAVERHRERREDRRENIKDRREDRKEDIRERRDGSKENMKNRRDEKREGAKERRGGSRDQIKDRRENQREKAKDRRGDVQEKRQNRGRGR